MAYAIAGEYGGWTTLLEADGTFLADLCDADACVAALVCSECAKLQAHLAAARSAEEGRDGE